MTDARETAGTGPRPPDLNGGQRGYLGPRGTFCEEAVSVLHPGGGTAAVPFPSIEAALDAVRAGTIPAAVVPIESSVDGGVTATLDELALGAPLAVRAEADIPVAFALLALPGTELTSVKLVGGHPAAQPQCRRWMAANLPDATWQAALSNADAARLVAERRLDAALAGRFAASHYGLRILVPDVHDRAAVTRFVEVSLPGPLPAPTGADRTSVVAFLADDHPGALMDILSQFAARSVNLTRIESRPTGNVIGRYCFFIDCAGHVAQASVGEALMGLRRICSEVRFLGSYPCFEPGDAGDHQPELQESVFAGARAWLDRVRSGQA
jgi:prephenate dehydratase